MAEKTTSFNVMNNTAAIYLRYSSDMQNDATIHAQRRICEAFAEQEGYNIILEYVDQAESATTSDNREAFLNMLSDAKKGKFKFIIVWQFSRFARNKEESVIYKAMLRKVGVKVISATEKTDDTPSGKLLEGMLEVLNQYFSDNLSVEVKKGKKENVLTGKHAGGKLPFGYYKDDVTETIKIDETKARTVIKIFSLYLQGYGMRRIGMILAEKGYKAPERKTWSTSTIRQILENEAYIGIYTYTLGKGTETAETFKIDNIYPRIIEPSVWADMKRIKASKQPKRSKRNRLYILTGKTVCGCCNKNYVGHSGSQIRKGVKVKHYYYRCNGKAQIAGKEKCKNKDVNAEKIEEWVLEQIAEHILSDKAMETILESVSKKINEKSKNSDKQIKKLEKEAAELDSQLDRFYDLYGMGKLSKARLEKKTESLEKALANVTLELNQLQNIEVSNVDIGAIKRFLIKSKNNMASANENTKKAIIDAFVHQIIIGSDDVRLTLKIDEEIGKSISTSLEEGNYGNAPSMLLGAVTNSYLIEWEIIASFEEATKKRYSVHDPDYNKYSAERREYRRKRKAKNKG